MSINDSTKGPEQFLTMQRYKVTLQIFMIDQKATIGSPLTLMTIAHSRQLTQDRIGLEVRDRLNKRDAMGYKVLNKP